MLMIGSNDIGGGFVRRAFTLGTERLKPGTPLTAEQINGIVNRRSLINSGAITVYPPRPAQDLSGQRFVVHMGGGRYDVICGAKLNEIALTKDQAEELAANPN